MITGNEARGSFEADKDAEGEGDRQLKLGLRWKKIWRKCKRTRFLRLW